MECVGTTIHKYITESDYSIREVACITKISTGTLNKIFNGKRTLSCDVASKLTLIIDSELVYSWLRDQTEYDIRRLKRELI